VLSGRGLCVGLTTHPEESYRAWCVSECDLEATIMRSTHTKGCWVVEKKTRRVNRVNEYGSIGYYRLLSTGNHGNDTNQVVIILPRYSCKVSVIFVRFQPDFSSPD